MKFQSNSYIFIQQNPFENVVSKMTAIFSRPQCVKTVEYYFKFSMLKRLGQTTVLTLVTLNLIKQLENICMDKQSHPP